MIGFPPPERMAPGVARAHYAMARITVVAYLFMIGVIALMNAALPHPVWAMPLGIAIVSGARASRWCMAYRRHVRKSRGIEA